MKAETVNAGSSPVERGVRPLVERLAAAACGVDEWRVQDPKDGSHCIGFSWPEVCNPEREAREWLADQKRRYPGSTHAGYEVARVRVLPQKEALLLEAQAEIERLRAGMGQLIRERRGAESIRECLQSLLRAGA